jgi:hypothetical protein
LYFSEGLKYFIIEKNQNPITQSRFRIQGSIGSKNNNNKERENGEFIF